MLRVVKIGGNVVDNPQKLEAFLQSFAKLSGDKVLVHGGGKIATTISKSLGITATMVEGRRVTDAQTLDVVTMVYAGLINKKIVATLQAIGVNSFGLSGADGGLIVSKKREVKAIDYGFVGDPIAFNFATASHLIDGGYTMVVAPITADDSGQLLNTNADTVAQTVAVGLSSKYKVQLIYCFEKAGVLSNIEDENSLIKNITSKNYASLKESGVVSDGMVPKIENAMTALSGGVAEVVICSSDALLKEGFGGTTITL